MIQSNKPMEKTLITIALTASATAQTFISPVAVDTGVLGEGNTGSLAEYMIDGSGLSTFDASGVHSYRWVGNEWHASTPTSTLTYPASIQFDLGSNIDNLLQIHVWNEERNGIEHFNLEFYDASNTLLGSTPSYSLSNHPDSVDYAADTFSFSPVSGVRFVDLVVTSGFSSSGLAIGEVAFSANPAIPEPSSTILLGLSSLVLLRRRRR